MVALFLLNAIRWRIQLGTHGGNISAQHGRKLMQMICRFIFLSEDEILYIIDEDGRRNDSAGMSLAFQPLH